MIQAAKKSYSHKFEQLKIESLGIRAVVSS